MYKEFKIVNFISNFYTYVCKCEKKKQVLIIKFKLKNYKLKFQMFSKFLIKKLHNIRLCLELHQNVITLLQMQSIVILSK